MTEHTLLTGADLIARGYTPGKWFKDALKAANLALMYGGDPWQVVADRAPPPFMPLRDSWWHPLPYLNAVPETDEESQNLNAVYKHMLELMRVPTVVSGAIMPDACPAGQQPGTIPVGGVVATKNAIHPGMHSADICCSMAMTVLSDVNPTKVLDAAMKHSHFGGGGRPENDRFQIPPKILARIEGNALLKPFLETAKSHFGTQGDGNHFFYVGRIESTGEIAIVTHHGSRGLGAQLYKVGMRIAEYHRQRLSPETPKHNAWIEAESKDGELYWDALQIVRAWTKASHFMIHNRVAEVAEVDTQDRVWNEHNFVFRKTDGLYYHAKGATPSYAGYAHDDQGLTLIPMNMAEPILITRHADAEHGLGFAPHGAGRNFSRTEFLRRRAGQTIPEIVAEETAGIDARFFCGVPDASELPGAYKNAASVRRQIDDFKLATVVDQIHPVGSIMAGDWQHDAPWRKK